MAKSDSIFVLLKQFVRIALAKWVRIKCILLIKKTPSPVQKLPYLKKSLYSRNQQKSL